MESAVARAYNGGLGQSPNNKLPAYSDHQISHHTFVVNCNAPVVDNGVAKGGSGPQSSRQNISIPINCTKFANLVSLFS